MSDEPTPIHRARQGKRSPRITWDHPAGARIGPYAAFEHPGRPPIDDPHARRWFEGFEELALAVFEDTDRIHRAADGPPLESFPLTLGFAHHGYALSELAAMNVCAAWAQGTYLYAQGAWAQRPHRIARVSEALILELKAGGARVVY